MFAILNDQLNLVHIGEMLIESVERSIKLLLKDKWPEIGVNICDRIVKNWLNKIGFVHRKLNETQH